DSGGPVLNSSGDVLGIVTIKVADGKNLACCIPAQVLLECLSRSDTLTHEARAKMLTVHRLNCAVNQIEALNEVYLMAMMTYINAMKVSISRGGTVDDGLRAARTIAEPQLTKFAQTVRDLEYEIAEIACDEAIGSVARKWMEEFWACFVELRDYVDN